MIERRNGVEIRVIYIMLSAFFATQFDKALLASAFPWPRDWDLFSRDMRVPVEWCGLGRAFLS